LLPIPKRETGRLSGEHEQDVVERRAAHVGERLLGEGSGVRGEHDLWQVEQRMAKWQGLGVGDVKTGAGQPLGT